MYHIELRQFPHNFCRFNMDEAELRRSVLDAWVRGEPVGLGERQWDPRQASLTVLDGPRLAVQELALGRGWRNAQRRSSDVTASLLGALPGSDDRAIEVAEKTGTGGPPEPSVRRESSAAPSGPAGPAAGAAAVTLAQLQSLLGDDSVALLRAWQIALERHPDRSPSQCLALAEDFVRG